MGTRFLWDPVEDNIVKELNDSNATVADYTTEPYLYGDLISQDRSGQSRFYHFDAQGSTMELTDSSGNVTDTRRYSAFGETTEASGSTTFPFKYIGRKGYYLNDIIGEYVARRRPYMPRRIRWSSIDPLMSKADSYNQYQYVNNNPQLFIDPSGAIVADETNSGLEKFIDIFEDTSEIKEILESIVKKTGIEKVSPGDIVSGGILSQGTDAVFGVAKALEEFKPETVCGRWFRGAIKALICASQNCDKSLCGAIYNEDDSSEMMRCLEDLKKCQPGPLQLNLDTWMKKFSTKVGTNCNELAYNSKPCCKNGAVNQAEKGCGKLKGC